MPKLDTKGKPLLPFMNVPLAAKHTLHIGSWHAQDIVGEEMSCPNLN
jgi:hypothetical protein